MIKSLLKHNLIKALLAIVAVIIINSIAQKFYGRLDVTKDKRYTLSEASKQTLTGITEPIYVDVYLGGEVPAEFKRLQFETQQLLEEYSQLNNNIIVTYINPKDINEDLNIIVTEMQNYGMPPARVDIKENGKTSQEIIFPWAVINHNKKVAKVPLLKNNAFNSVDRINNSVQHLEYAFANAFKTVSNTNKKTIAYLIGNKQLESKYVYDFLHNTLRQNYNVISVSLDSAQQKPIETLKQLQNFDLSIIAKPKQAFNDSQKYILDQYTVNGGKSLWLIDAVHAEMDSIRTNGSTLTILRDLNLKDLFFEYGFRVNPVITKDMYASDIVLADENNQYNQYPWFYNPLVTPTIKHEIVNNITPVKFEFANTIDLVKQGVNLKKTPLLQTSGLSKTIGPPIRIGLEEISGKGPDFNSYNKQNLTLAALIEGQFSSAFKHRVKPFKYKNHLDSGPESKMVIVADGDVIKNDLEKGTPLPLGLDKWTRKQYGNKEFLLNAVDYMLDDSDLLKVRNKEVKIPFLDPKRIEEQKTKWQVLNIIIPLVILFLIGVLNLIIRKRRYQ